MLEVLTEVSSFVVQAHDIEKDLALFVQDAEPEEQEAIRLENKRNYLLGYEKENQLTRREDRLSEDLKMLIAEQHIDDMDYVYSSSNTQAAIRVTIQKSYEMEVFNEEKMEMETINGWFNLTAKDLGKGTLHKRKDKETGNEYRVAYVFDVDEEGTIYKGDDGDYLINTDRIKQDLDMNLVYTAGSYVDLVFIDGEDYRMVVSHSKLSEVIGVNYDEEGSNEYVELDGGAVVGIQPKDRYSFDTDKYKENQRDSQAEVMFGRSADIILGTTQLFYSEWQERRKEISEEKELIEIASKVKVSRSAAKIRALSSPFYSLVMELNSLYEEGKTKELAELALKNRSDADDILDYARKNKAYASLISDRDVIGLTPYLAIRKYKTKVSKSVANKAALIDEKTRELVLRLKETMNQDLITEDNAKDVVKAARAGGEFRMDGDYKALYMYARKIQNEIDAA